MKLIDIIGLVFVIYVIRYFYSVELKPRIKRLGYDRFIACLLIAIVFGIILYLIGCFLIGLVPIR